ncbi:hypothetical protein ACT3CE_18800 [Marinifilum sp. RC60d5]|uniref:hypothetical protein n=1 Tax=Marinifilum sp. RC60d5 TaxID=3458414 RepID=UPI004035971C
MKDIGVEYSDLLLPERWKCTYKIHGSSLDVCCKKYNIALNHHEALSDARAYGELYLIYLKELMF